MAHPDTVYDDTAPGFSWWMLIIFLVVVGGLIYILVPNLFRARAGGLFTMCQSNCKNIGTALELYSADNNRCYPPRMDMLTPDYLKTIPTCEGYKAKIEIIRRKRPTYCDTYTVSDDFSAYTFYCGSEDHSLCGVQDNYPQYCSKNGLIPK